MEQTPNQTPSTPLYESIEDSLQTIRQLAHESQSSYVGRLAVAVGQFGDMPLAPYHFTLLKRHTPNWQIGPSKVSGVTAVAERKISLSVYSNLPSNIDQTNERIIAPSKTGDKIILATKRAMVAQDIARLFSLEAAILAINSDHFPQPWLQAAASRPLKFGNDAEKALVKLLALDRQAIGQELGVESGLVSELKKRLRQRNKIKNNEELIDRAYAHGQLNNVVADTDNTPASLTQREATLTFDHPLASNREIDRKFGFKHGGARAARQQVQTKFGVQTREAAYIYALQQGWITKPALASTSLSSSPLSRHYQS